MWEVLAEAERALPELLADGVPWSTLDVDYHPPRVERLFRAWGAHRVHLHYIHPCEPGAALVHRHPWPSAMRLLAGRYEMTVGYGAGDAAPPVAMRLVVGAGARYEMTDPDGWHAVRPLDGPALTLMVTGPPWGTPGPRPGRVLTPLSAGRTAELVARFRALC